MYDFEDNGCLLRIFVDETDKKDNVPLYEWLIHRAKQEKLAGATALRGIEGYGGENAIHTARILQLSSNLPIIVEIIDTDEKIKKFLPIVEEAMDGGLATLEKIKIKFYQVKH